jgi:hypothetical protein
MAAPRAVMAVAPVASTLIVVLCDKFLNWVQLPTVFSEHRTDRPIAARIPSVMERLHWFFGELIGSTEASLLWRRSSRYSSPVRTSMPRKRTGLESSYSHHEEIEHWSFRPASAVSIGHFTRISHVDEFLIHSGCTGLAGNAIWPCWH